jgi:hypothetical protein
VATAATPVASQVVRRKARRLSAPRSSAGAGLSRVSARRMTGIFTATCSRIDPMAIQATA